MLVGGTGLAQCPVAVGQLRQCLSFQQVLAAWGHSEGHGWCCKDSKAVGISLSSLPTSTQVTLGIHSGAYGKGA